jgi:hypothetical protein
MTRELSFIRSSVMGIIALAASTVWMSSSAQGQLTHYVPFDTGYTAGGLLHESGGSDLGFGANTWFDASDPDEASIVGGNLSGLSGLPAAGNHASTAPANFNLNFYTMDQNNNGVNGEAEDRLAPGVHWLSMVARADAGADFAGFSFVKFFGPEVLYIGKVGGATSTLWGLDQGAAGGVTVAGSDVTLDTLLVAKLTIGAGADDDFVDLYINPALGAAPPLTADIAGYAFNEDSANNRALDEIRLGSQNGAFFADEIRIGATFGDVVGVPEPTSCVVLGVVAMLGCSTRRRR